METKFYIGDAVYVEFDKFGDIVLTTEDGVNVTNRVVLDRVLFEYLVEKVHDYSKTNGPAD